MNENLEILTEVQVNGPFTYIRDEVRVNFN